MSEELNLIIEGRNAVIEALKSDRSIDKILIQKGNQEGSINSVIKEAKKRKIVTTFVEKEKLDSVSEGTKHQGVIAYAAAYNYATIEDVLLKAQEQEEDPFIIILDSIMDPHNLGAIIRTANIAGAHGIVIPKRRAVGLTATVAKTSAGAINYTPIVKVTNLSRTIEELKEKGLWFVCGDMDGDSMYDIDLKGAIGLVVGSEGEGVSKNVKEKCDFVASIPMSGEINSLNASVATGVLAFEVVRQRLRK
ncbi:23S rRNA (guanosine2251-2'-O)-methyltransferase [Natranaerovirga hydrolytica]|uniref:23S rRNA (Guanosine2251-2'-O)-methyltransferase n=1 Tax=Natranaerovirga hydrolytica TaxID=680378 RepID=A0A4R1MZV6_9FIRM|nr:23S rRNA (guanosine(2251)-2'-O)-methyltransferase RlmB [Natranaerovirga hydrolytica]TCK98826.1 23S rRNA (guanosine2251-2'-O)-methyltransferase [Natranaerovirga hydrolytica]